MEEEGLVPKNPETPEHKPEEIIPTEYLPTTDSEVVNKSLQLVMGADIFNQAMMGFKTRCTICNSTCRKEVEKLYEENTASWAGIQQFLAEQGVTVSVTSIRHHFKEHYNSKERMMILVDYCDNIAEMLKNRRDRMQQLEMMCAIGQKELLHACSTPTGGSLEKEKDRLDLIMKAQKMVGENIKLMKEMDDAEAKAKAVYVSVITTFKNKMEQCKTEEEKKVWKSLLVDFRQSLPDMGGGQ